MIHEEICTYEVCKLAKAKGFPQDECGVNIGYYAWDGLRKTHPLVNSFAWYNDEYNHDNLFLAPTQSLLQRWLREERKWNIVVRMYKDKGYYWFIQNSKGQLQTSYFTYADEMFSTYEEALKEAIKYALENLV